MLRRKKHIVTDVPMASMADIAFLLLVFFLTSTVFDEEKGLSLILPAAGEEVDVAPANVIFFLVQDDGFVDVKRGESPQVQRVTRNDVGAVWLAESVVNPLLIAAVKTAPTAPYAYMVDVLDEFQQNGAQRISLQALIP